MHKSILNIKRIFSVYDNTIKVSDETKQLLDMLQAKMTLKFQKKKTLTELVDTIILIAFKHENDPLNIEKYFGFDLME